MTKGYPRTEWSEERTEAFRRAWRKGATDPQLAKQFGVTPQACIGKRRRLGLPVNARSKSHELTEWLVEELGE